MAARWRKEPGLTGLARVVQGPRGYELCENGKRLMWVSFASKRYGHNGKWYWGGMGQNTFGTRMFDTKEEAKADANAYYKANKPTKEPS
jgi:hypothetical protein